MPIVKVGDERIKFPDTMSEEQIKAALDSRFAQPATVTQVSEPSRLPVEQPPSEGFSIGETISNIPSSAVRLAEDIVTPIIHPVETAKSLAALGQGIVEKLIPDGDSGPGEHEASVDAVVGFLKDRYGSVDAFTKTVQEDPVGVLADISGIITAGSTLVPKIGKVGKVASAAKTAGIAIDPLNVSVSAAKTIGKAGTLIPESLPMSLFEGAVKFRPSIKQAQRVNMVRTALDQGIMPTVNGLRTVSEKLDVLDGSLNKIINEATEAGVKIPKDVLFKELKTLRAKLGGVKVSGGGDVRIINNVAKEFNENLKRLKKDKLTPREVQDLKTDAYKRINFDMSQGGAVFAKNETTKAIAKQAKESLEGISPDIKSINKEMGDLIELNTELERAVSRLGNRNIMSLDTSVKTAAGAATGSPVGVAAGVGASVLGAPKVKARTAIILENIRRNAETIEIAKNKLPPAAARAFLTQAGRIDQALREELEKE